MLGRLKKVISFSRPGPKKERINALLNPPPGRKDVRNLKIQDDLHIQVYWKIVEIGKGPALILFVYDIAAIKFDLFGEGDGHFHIDSTEYDDLEEEREARIFMPEKTALAQLDRAVYELKHNRCYYLQQSPHVRIRNFKVDESAFDATLEEARAIVINMLDSVPEIAGI